MAQKRPTYSGQDYGSDFDYDSEVERKKAKRRDLTETEPSRTHVDRPHKSQYIEERSRDESRYMRHHLISTNAYARHKELVNNYLMYYGGKMSDFTAGAVRKTDHDIIRENHQFVWEDGEEGDNWDKQLAKKYYEKLYKEYCIADLSRYKENKVALRWRVEKEVVNGKGQFICGNKKCDKEEALRSWEVNFAYLEHGNKKNALVKIRLCEKCSKKLNFNSQKKEVTKSAMAKPTDRFIPSDHAPSTSTSRTSRDDGVGTSPDIDRNAARSSEKKRMRDHNGEEEEKEHSPHRSEKHKHSKERGRAHGYRDADRRYNSEYKDVRTRRNHDEMENIVDGLLL